MTRVRASERSDMNIGGAGDRTSDVPKAMGMDMAVAAAVTRIAMDTASVDTLESIEPKENGKRRRRRRSEALTAALGPGDRKSHMERTAQQQARELAQLHRTIAKMAGMQVA